jgi:hypothetical protein
MSHFKLDRWKGVLLEWGVWRDSVINNRDKVLEERKDLDKLVNLGKPKYKTTSTGDKYRFSIKTNEQYELLCGLFKDLSNIGSEFIADELRIRSGSEIHRTLLDFWMVAVVPELCWDYDGEQVYSKVFQEIEKLYISQASRASKKDRGNIIDSISWIRGETSPKEAARQLLEIEWPDAIEVKRQARGGRPSRELEKDIEAIICITLYNEYKSKKYKKIYKYIADQFSWETYVNEYGKRICSTVKERLARGRRLVKMHGVAK